MALARHGVGQSGRGPGTSVTGRTSPQEPGRDMDRGGAGGRRSPGGPPHRSPAVIWTRAGPGDVGHRADLPTGARP